MTLSSISGRRLAAALAILLFTAGKLSAQTIEIENLDGVPFADRLVFNRIGSLSDPPTNGVHELVTLRVRNAGSEALTITALSKGGDNPGRWIIEGQPSLPAAIAPDSSLDLLVRYQAECCRGVHKATLSITSDDPTSPTVDIELRGYWQPASEGRREPSVEEIIEIFGYATRIVSEGEVLDQKGKIQAVGDEILSPYWRKANDATPVSVRQLATFHTYPSRNRLYWYYKGSTTTSILFAHHREDAQSLLPRLYNSSLPAEGSFNPSSSEADGVFGFRVENVWSDPSLNDKSKDDCSGGSDTCGHHMRFWPAKDRQGVVLVDTYIMIMNQPGWNFDYNDNLYLITNIRPDTSSQGGEPTGVESDATDLPSRFELYGNFPNPFNPQTTIRYSLPEPVHVRLEVSDLLGRPVSLLIDEPQEAGFHNTNFDGSRLPSGLYLYRIEAGSFRQTKQMILLK